MVRQQNRRLVVGAMSVILILIGIATALTHAQSHGSSSLRRIEVIGNRLVDTSGTTVQLVGVNLDGTQSACTEGSSTSWGPIDSHEAKAIRTWHADVVRIPLNEDCWLGINNEPSHFASIKYRTNIIRWVRELNKYKLIVVLDLHWTAPGAFQARQEWPMPDQDHSVTFWRDVARTFAAYPGVMFDIFNEPYVGLSHPSPRDWDCWRDGCTRAFQVCRTVTGYTVRSCFSATYHAAGMQDLVDAVRNAGARQVILVGSPNWSGDPCGLDDSPAPNRCMWVTHEPSDPVHQLAISLHSYNHSACSTVNCWTYSLREASILTPIPIITTEFGESDCSATFVKRFMDWADREKLSYLAWAWDVRTPTVGCASANMDLLQSWGGSPNEISPAPAAIAANFSYVRRAPEP